MGIQVKNLTKTFDNKKICQATATSLGMSNSGCDSGNGTLTYTFKQS